MKFLKINFPKISYSFSRKLSRFPFLKNHITLPKKVMIKFKNIKQWNKANIDIDFSKPYYLWWQTSLNVQSLAFSGGKGVLTAPTMLLKISETPWEENLKYLIIDEVFVEYNDDEFLIYFFRKATRLFPIANNSNGNYYSKSVLNEIYRKTKKIELAYSSQEEIGLTTREIIEAAESRRNSLHYSLMKNHNLTMEKKNEKE
ncbi:hypothetical protein SAMN02745179_00297 [Mycoplasmopsis agassizii]|uniref:Uncharacterized protein n=2 Tax=Mycoplasmopsis agassizii TaxID=33922 RepID=A0ABX4H5F1_9BACT|nr:hypothetical protein CJF60_00370 [Mycoplasmopsis agassizii]SMC16646.1 hypothetical protein SAMN02745179_00297 [Mycoplasmopsis agassizii]